MTNNINLHFSETILQVPFQDFVEKNKNNFTQYQYLKLKSSKVYKTFLDLDEDIIKNQLELFLEKHDSLLRSKNKSNASFEIKNNISIVKKKYLKDKKEFFENNGFYHHHLITKEIYNKKKYMKFNINKNLYEKTNIDVITGFPISEIIDNTPKSVKRAQTSNLLLHYQKINNNYRLLFITHHLESVEWDDLYDDLSIIFDLDI